MVARIIEVPLELKRDGPLSVRDLSKTLGTPSAFIKVFENAKITLDTGGLQELIRAVKPDSVSEEGLEDMLKEINGILADHLTKVGTIILAKTTLGFYHGDKEKLVAFYNGTAKLEDLLGHQDGDDDIS